MSTTDDLLDRIGEHAIGDTLILVTALRAVLAVADEAVAKDDLTSYGEHGEHFMGAKIRRTIAAELGV